MGSKLICKLHSVWHPAEISVYKVLGKTLVQTSAHVGSWARVKFLLWPFPGSGYVTPGLTGATELLSEDHFHKIAYTQ